MKRPVGLIVGAVAGATLIAAVGASAHTGVFSASKTPGTHQAQLGSEASGARVDPEPIQSPEPTETPEPAQVPAPAVSEPAEGAETEQEGENDTEDAAEAAATSKPAPAIKATSGEQEGHGGDGKGEGGGD
jgi:hypothetical protein